MPEIFYKFFYYVINIDAVLLIALFLGLVLLQTRWRKGGRWFLNFVGIFLFIIVVSPLHEWSVVTLENRFPKPHTLPKDVTGLILLGGSFAQGITAARGELSYSPAAGRTIAFIKLAKAHPKLKLIFTGGGTKGPGIQSEAGLTKTLFEHMSLDPSRVDFEDKSKNTIENAVLSFEKFRPNPNEKWILVTSAIHMPRSIGLFRKAGWNVSGYPVDYHSTGIYEKNLNFSILRAFYAWHFSAREWSGMIYNYVAGYSDTLFPGPN